MIDATAAQTPQRKRGGWLRILAWTVGILVALLVVVYFVATSSAFFKGVILPRVSDSLHAEVTVSDASIHPFREVVLRDLKVQAKGREPVVTAPEVRVSYSLFDIIGGNIHVDEIALVSPTVQVVENPDGSSNLDPFLKSQKEKPAEKQPAQPSKPSKAAQIDLRKLTLSNATFLNIKNYKGGNRDAVELTNVNLTVEGVKNGQAGRLQLSAGIRIDNHPPAPGTNGLLAATLNGNFTISLTPDLKPASLSGSAHLDIAQAGGSYSDLATLGAALDCEVTPADIKQVALHFQKGGASVGQLLVSGPFDIANTEGRLKVELIGIDKKVLNVAGAKSGIDFGPTVINSTNEIQLSKAGSVIVATGRFNANKVQLTQAQQTTPSLDFHADYDVTVDRTAQTALLRGLTLSGTENGALLFGAQLTSPMNVAWGSATGELGDSSLNLTVTNLNLADWKPFLGGNAPRGTVDAALKLSSQQGGKQIAFELNAAIENLAAQLGSNRISQANVTLQARGQATNLKQINLSEYKLQFSQQNQPMLTVSGSGNYNLDGGAADAQIKLQAALARLAQLQPQPGLSVSSGDMEMNVHVTQKLKTQSFDVTSAVSNLSASIGGNQISQAGMNVEAHGQATDMEQVNVSEYKLQITSQNKPGLDVTGSCAYNLADGSADVQVKLQAALAQLLQALPQPGMSVSSGDVSLTAHVMQKDKAQSITGDLALANFTGQIGKNDFRNYAGAINLDVGNSPSQIQIRKVAGNLSQGGNAGGSFEVSGSCQPAKKSVDVNVKLAGLNQNALRPFLEPLLADTKLASIAINGNAAVQYNPDGDSALRADMQVTNLVVSDPTQRIPATPLEAKLQADAAVHQQTADVRQFQITLTPTDRAKNQIQLQGRVDFSRADAIQGNLKLMADSLDVTRYYDLFAGKSQTAEKKPGTAASAAAPAASSPAAASQEPAPVKLPFRNFTTDANIGRFYLHEIEITNLQAGIKIDGGHVLVKPFQLALNGAPVNATADLDLGVPGWTYDVSLDASRIPVLPIANSVVPDANGKYNGLVSAGAQVKGRGMTGTNLKQNLNGNASLTLSGANIQLIESRTKIFFIPIDIKLIATLLNIPEIMQSPLTAVNVKLNASNGRIDVQQAQVISPAFLANVHGVIPIADVLANSPLNMPVEVSLTNSLAAKLSLSKAQAAPSAGFTQLPVFLTVAGTIGNVETKKNTIVLVALTARAAGGLVGGGVGNAGKAGGGLLQGIEGLLTGGTPGTNTANTNQPAANKSPINNLLNQLLKPKK
jgi:AsmA-like protein